MTSTWTSQVPRGRIRYVVEVHGTDDAHKATRIPVRFAATEQTALRAVIEVLQQWAASQGAIRPGTKITIVDKNDGGQLFVAEYLGYGETLLTGKG